MNTLQLPEIPESEKTPLVLALLGIIANQQDQLEVQEEHIALQQNRIDVQQEQIHLLKEQVQVLKDEVAHLKGHNPKPKVPPSALEKDPDKKKWKKGSGKKRPGSKKRKKTARLDIHETQDIHPKNLPIGSKLKGYSDWTVQDLQIQAHNTLYRLAYYRTPSGEYVSAELPDDTRGEHFGVRLRCFILQQYYQARATQGTILDELADFGIDISSGQLNRIITEGKDDFHAEKDEILRVGLEVSRSVHVDDTGARHNGKNGYCTHIGNDLFAWFSSTKSKSRINFLTLLGAGRIRYTVNGEALDYMRAQKLPQIPFAKLSGLSGMSFNGDSWKNTFAEMNITNERHVRVVTEGALIGGLLENGFNPDLVIVSDDAGQFNVFLHALCWIHAERTIHKLVGFNDRQREALEAVRKQIWDFYRDLKNYKLTPTKKEKALLGARFDEIFTTKYDCFATLTHALERLHKNRAELLLVLDRPDLDLHNNLSERDIREYVTKRKISGSTRSDLGRRCRDTFTSLKKTCRKLGVSFWSYLTDRVSGRGEIPNLPDLIRIKAQESKA